MKDDPTQKKYLSDMAYFNGEEIPETELDDSSSLKEVEVLGKEGIRYPIEYRKGSTKQSNSD